MQAGAEHQGNAVCLGFIEEHELEALRNPGSAGLIVEEL